MCRGTSICKYFSISTNDTGHKYPLSKTPLIYDFQNVYSIKNELLHLVKFWQCNFDFFTLCKFCFWIDFWTFETNFDNVWSNLSNYIFALLDSSFNCYIYLVRTTTEARYLLTFILILSSEYKLQIINWFPFF